MACVQRGVKINSVDGGFIVMGRDGDEVFLLKTDGQGNI